MFKYKKWLTVSRINKQYSDFFFDRGNELLDNLISEKKHDLDNLKNKENIEILTERYSSEMVSQIESTKNEIEEMKSEIKKMKDKKERTEAEVEHMRENQVVLCEYKWDKSGSFSNYGKYTVTYGLCKSQGYPVDVPITKREIKISPPTYQYKDTYDPEHSVSVTEFYSVTFGDKAGTVIKSVIFGFIVGSSIKYSDYSDDIKKQACKGTVTFYGKESDKE